MLDVMEIKNKMASSLGEEVSVLRDDALLTDLVDESFALVELMIELQEEFKVRFFAQDDLRDVKTVGQLIQLLESHAVEA